MHFHSRNHHGDGAEDEEDDEQELDDRNSGGEVQQWNLRRCSAAAIDTLSGVYGIDILVEEGLKGSIDLSSSMEQHYGSKLAGVLQIFSARTLSCQYSSHCCMTDSNMEMPGNGRLPFWPWERWHGAV